MKRNWKVVTVLLLFVAAFFYIYKGSRQVVSRAQRRSLAGQRLRSTTANDGKQVFRFETFGDEAFWTDALKLPQAISGSDLGGLGPGLSLRNALALGLKIDSQALPADFVEKLKEGTADLDDPGTTIDLLGSNAVVGMAAGFDDFLFFRGAGKLKAIGTSCAFCHSTVDDSVVPGVGHRLDGWPNRDLNVGAIISMAADLGKLAKLRGTDDATLRGVLNGWGPLIPPIFGPAGFPHRWTGTALVTHWNAFIARPETHGISFFDPRFTEKQKSDLVEYLKSR